MNKYLWAECPIDIWPEIKTIMAKSYNDAIERIIRKYSIELDDDFILGFNDWDEFREHLNDKYDLALSDLELYEEL